MTCPCKTKLTDEQKDLHTNPNGKSFVQNKAGEQAGSLSAKLGSSLNKITALQAALMNPTQGSIGGALGSSGVNMTQLNALSNNVTRMQSVTNIFKNQADKLSDPQTLMGLVGSMNFYANIGCALGIEGLDVTTSVGVHTSNGINSLSVAGNVQVDLDKLMDKFGSNSGGSALGDAADSFNAGMEAISSKINEATDAMNKIANDSMNMISEAAAKIAEYTQINFFSNLVGSADDPCNKIGVAVTESMLTQEFQQLAGVANASTATGGTFTR